MLELGTMLSGRTEVPSALEARWEWADVYMAKDHKTKPESLQ